MAVSRLGRRRTRLPEYGHALGLVLIVSAALYLVTALVMLALPKTAVEHAG
ncbi:hypothetical protein ABZ470_39170 [Streptosporangium sp. NPDC020072]|uniref:hypothetical protein n=1 Tax=Streptosporangium sp. NPDC020072 TaxID=3154788 RepID=UPI003418C26D